MKRKAKNTRLSKQAEQIVTGSRTDISGMSPDDVAALVNKLEIQNEELRGMQQELQKSRDLYIDLYDYAPVGHFTIDRRTNNILEVNLTGCSLLGMERADVKKTRFTRFIDPDHADTFYFCRKRATTSLTRELCDIEMRRGDGTSFWAGLEMLAVKEKQCFHIAMQDISARKDLGSALKVSEERFRIMADNSPFMIWVTDAGGMLQFVNRTYYEFFGVTVEQVQGSKWQPLVHPEDSENYVNEFLTSLREFKPFHAEARVRHNDGEWRWVESFGTPYFSNSGELLGMVGSSPDITERKGLEQELEEQRDRFRYHRDRLQAMLDTTPHGVIVLEGKEGVINYVNRRGVELCGGDPSGLEIKDHSTKIMKLLRMDGALYPPHDLPASRALLYGESVKGQELLIERPDGSRISVAAHATPIRDKEGAITGSIIIFEDITRQKELERLRDEHHLKIQKLLAERSRELRYSEENFGRLFNSMIDGALVLNTNGAVLFANPAALELFNTTEDRFIGSKFGTPAIEGSTEMAVMRKDSPRTVEIRSSEVKWSDASAHLLILRDITPRKQAEDWIRMLSIRLVEAQEKERQHIGRELHDEVGGGLTALRLTLERAQRLSQGQGKAKIEEANKLLDHTMKHVRTISHGLRPDVLSDFGLEKALRWYISRYSDQRDVRVNLVYKGKGRLPENLETAVYRIVQEALTNAAKYSGASEVTVKCQLNEGALNLIIEDNGCGFDAGSISMDSMGISGMYDRVFLLGGLLTVDSTPGVGTRIACELSVRYPT